MPGYSTESLAALFTVQDETQEERLEKLRHKNVWGYRTKVIRSGPMLEVYLYPMLMNREEKRRAKEQISRKAQQNLNDQNAKLRVVRLVRANFDRGDLLVTLTYAEGYLPTEDQAHADVTEYLRAIRVYRQRRGMPALKYLYVIEFGGEGGKEKRVHHHIIMNAMDRDDAEEIWGRGRANTKRLQPDMDGSLEGIARYIVKEKQQTKHPGEGQATSRKRWQGSRNLQKPVVLTYDRRISKRRVQAAALDCRVAGKEIFERQYPAYKMEACEARTSHNEFMAGVHVYAKMYLRQDAPPWSARPGAAGGQKEEGA